MNMKKKMIISISVILLLIASTFIYQYITGQQTLKKIKEIEQKTLISALLTDELKLAVVEVQQWLSDISATRGLDGLDEGFEMAELYAKKFYEHLSHYTRINPEQEEDLQKIRISFENYYNLGKKMADEYIKGGTELGNKIMGEFDQSSADINNLIDALREDNLEKIEHSIHTIEQQTQKANGMIFFGSLLIVLVCFSIPIMLGFNITRAFNSIINDAEIIASGDLSQENVISSNDEIGRLSQALDIMRRHLLSIIAQVQQTSVQLSDAAAELSSGVRETTKNNERAVSFVQEITNGLHTQTASTEEITKAMDEMAIGISKIADSSSSVSELAKHTEQETIKGNETIQSAVQRMNHVLKQVSNAEEIMHTLGDHAKNITKIVEVMGSISSQTQLLALNASIEAVHANENGNSFAVVADEVRKLADQAKKATDQIATMIEEMQTSTKQAMEAIQTSHMEVSEGTRIVQDAGKAFDQIMQASAHVTEQILALSAASEQMMAGAEQVSTSADQLRQIAKTSAKQGEQVLVSAEEQLAAMQNIDASAHQVLQISNALVNETKKFKTTNSEN